MPAFDSQTPTPRWIEQDFSVFKNSHKFQDNIHGKIYLNQLERDIIDTPEFQRLGNIMQLGVVPLLFRTATHSRAAHSIGTCYIAKHFVHLVKGNTARIAEERDEELYSGISFFSELLISAGALLHDITHGPFSHDIERKSHHITRRGHTYAKVSSHYGAYPKHDDYKHNPTLYIALIDSSCSTLAKLLRSYSPTFSKLLHAEADRQDCEESTLAQLSAAVKTLWPNHEDELLGHLLFHLLLHERPPVDLEEVTPAICQSFTFDSPKPWGVGPSQKARQQIHKAWYQPYRHDIIGNTISADLLDYLLRDMHGLGIRREVDLSFLKHMALTNLPNTAAPINCILDLNDYKRGTIRTNTFDDLMRLLDLRYEIHQKAVMHRVVQSAVAMISRSAWLQSEGDRPLSRLFGWNEENFVPHSSDLGLLLRLTKTTTAGRNGDSTAIARKLSERRLYRPLMVIPGDRIDELLALGEQSTQNELYPRLLAAAIDSRFFAPFLQLMGWCIDQYLSHAFDRLEDVLEYLCKFSAAADNDLITRAKEKYSRRVIIWAPPYKQLYKDPKVRILTSPNGQPFTLDDLPIKEQMATVPEFFRQRVQAALADAQTKYTSLWKLFIFLSDGLFYSGTLPKLIPHHPCAQRASAHKKHLEQVQVFCVGILRTLWRHLQDSDICGHLEKAQMLNMDCTEHDIEALIGEVVTITHKLCNQPYSAAPVSAVRVDKYFHGPGEDDGDDAWTLENNLCRDSRYRFARFVDVTKRESWHPFCDDEAVIDHCADYVVGCGRDELPEYDLKEIIDRLGPTAPGGIRECELLPASPQQKGGRYSIDQLRALWRGDVFYTDVDQEHQSS